MTYYIFIYYHLSHFPFLPFTTIYYSFYYNLQFGNIYCHLFHLLQMVFFIYYHLFHLLPGQLGDAHANSLRSELRQRPHRLLLPRHRRASSSSHLATWRVSGSTRQSRLARRPVTIKTQYIRPALMALVCSSCAVEIYGADVVVACDSKLRMQPGICLWSLPPACDEQIVIDGRKQRWMGENQCWWSGFFTLDIGRNPLFPNRILCQSADINRRPVQKQGASTSAQIRVEQHSDFRWRRAKAWKRCLAWFWIDPNQSLQPYRLQLKCNVWKPCSDQHVRTSFEFRFEDFWAICCICKQ